MTDILEELSRYRQEAEKPEWHLTSKVHDWRNHVSERIKSMWYDIPIFIRLAIIEQADEQANNEEWD